jgi:uncharacterized SAM-binding protein YcdF (DUF218 family)
MNEVDKYAQIVWDYLEMDRPLEKSNCIIGLGSHDLRVAKRTAEIFLDGFAPFIVFAGGVGKHTPDKWNSEAEEFSHVAYEMGVPKDKVFLEDKSSNTGENILFSKKLLEEKGIFPKKIIIVHKPYMVRRAYAAFMKQWPGMEIIATSPKITYENYPNGEVSKEEAINTMVGDLLRIKKYPAQGYQIPQVIPEEVWEAGNNLLALGYNKYDL